MRQGGFTLLELLVVVAIIGILASVTFVRGDLMESDAEVNSAAQQVINMAKRARQQSVSVFEYRGIFPSYGLYFDMSNPREFIVYANCVADDNGDKEVNHFDNFAYNEKGHQDCEDVMDGSYTDAAKVETVELKGGAFIYNIETKLPEQDLKSADAVSVNYLRPEPTVWITGDVGGEEYFVSTGYTKITIRDSAERYQKDIFFYTSALIESEQKKLAD